MRVKGLRFDHRARHRGYLLGKSNYLENGAVLIIKESRNVPNAINAPQIGGSSTWGITRTVLIDCV